MKSLKTLLQEVTAGIKAWANANFSLGTHVHGNVSNNGKLATASKALITDSNKNITTSSVSDTELGYLSGVTSAIQTQLNAKATDSDVVHKTGNETVGGIKTFTKTIKNQSENLEIGVIPSSAIGIGYHILDKNNVIVANLYYNQYTSGNSELKLNLKTKDSNNNAVDKSVLLNTDQYGTWFNFRPSDNSSISLGSTNYRWSAVYSDSYYYGTTAWGLDKANVWTENNIFSKNASPASVTSIANTTLAFNGLFNTIFLNTRGSSNRRSYGSFLFVGYGSASGVDNYGQIQLLRSTDKRGDTNEGYIPDTSFKLWRVAPQSLIMDSMEAVRVTNDGTENSLKPITNNATDLGTSTNKWKTLNGINPGALSLPQATTNFEDLTGYVLDGVTENSFPISGLITLDGWLQCRVKHTLGVASFLHMETSYRIWTASDKDCLEEYVLWVPVKAGISFNKVVCKADDLKIRFHPMQGNV